MGDNLPIHIWCGPSACDCDRCVEIDASYMGGDCEGETQQDVSGYGWRDYDREPDTAFARWCVGILRSASLDSYGGSDE